MGWAFLMWARKNWLAIFIAFAALGLYMLGRSHGAEGPKAELAAYKAEIQKAVAERLAQNALKEAADKKEFERIAAQYEQDKINAQAKADAVIAGLRAGTLRLRKHWDGCRAASQAAGNSSGIDEDARLREADAGANVRDAAEADSWIKALQQGWQQCQKQYDP